MSTHKRIDVICIAAVILTIVLTVLLMNGKTFDIMPVMNEEAGSAHFTANDMNADWDISSATSIVLSDSGSTINGTGAYVHDGNVYIVYAGCYVLTGELTNGSVIIDADKSDKIWVLLDGAAIHCGDGAAIRVEQADNVFLTLADGTESTVSSGEQYSAENIASGVDGVIYSRDDLTINGTGALYVSTEYDHGIVCNDDLMITGGNITISAVQDGIHANDSVRIRNAAISISAGDDGISVSNDDETAFLYVESGSISIPACYEGLEAVDITIAGGTIDILATDDGINASGNGDNSAIRIAGGDITIINPTGRDADGLDSNGSIYVEGGKVFISVLGSGGNCALDYGSENGGECVVSGGTVIACGGSMMAEGFDAGSPQGFLIYNMTAEAGAEISLQDSVGGELLSEEIPCS
ncbi:MAG: carbohydrate-binding domain-containing protein, partial [Lachnospiraceae bacterium]|nr:carbohydrate-binding domain-containing protein [Lachnospiraceae bacterium]